MAENKDLHDRKLLNNKLNRIENRLKRLEILFLKNLKADKKIRKELHLLEKEEKNIEIEQKKLELEEKELLQDMRRVELEEKWYVEVQYNCKSKIMDDNNIVRCHKTERLCKMTLCPLVRRSRK